MATSEKFSLLRTILTTIGLPKDAVQEVLDWVTDMVSEKDSKTQAKPEYPYFTRDNFLSPAELSFYLVLRTVVSDCALISTKVNLGDLFYVKTHDNSKFRTYTNKIDRKHVDFLLCDPKTVKPIVGIELDDKSHQRQDRQERDSFVERVFEAASLPLVRVSARHTYSTTELAELLGPHFRLAKPVPAPEVLPETSAPNCPKCGGVMVLRTAKSGANQGGQFWGCTKYPECRGIVKA